MECEGKEVAEKNQGRSEKGIQKGREAPFLKKPKLPLIPRH